MAEERYLDWWFKSGPGRARDNRAASATEETNEPWLDPWFRQFRKTPESEALPGALRFLLGTQSQDSAFGTRLTAAFTSGRICLGRALSDVIDHDGDRFRLQDLSRTADLPVFGFHYQRIGLGGARLFRREHDCLAAILLADNHGGHAMARAVHDGRLPALSIGGTHRKRRPIDGGNEITGFRPTELSLVEVPAGAECYVLNLNHPKFCTFARVVLGLTQEDLPWL
jgi:hypothetical protein